MHACMHACMQVLHCRSCSGMGASSVRFLAACYLCFNMDHNTVLLALASLPPVISPRRMPSGQSAHSPLPSLRGNHPKYDIACS